MKKTQTVHIDPHSIPDAEYEIASSILSASIKLALSDPAKRKDYERFKAQKQAASKIK